MIEKEISSRRAKKIEQEKRKKRNQEKKKREKEKRREENKKRLKEKKPKKKKQKAITLDGFYTFKELNIERQIWYKDGKKHNLEGPAYTEISQLEDEKGITHLHLREEYWMNGELHNLNGPTIIITINDMVIEKEWFAFNKRHRDNTPAIINSTREEWYYHGELHREDGPAIQILCGSEKKSKWWYRFGKLHREDGGPAIDIFSDGIPIQRVWYRDGVIHRDSGPAIAWRNGKKEWWQNGIPHRRDGPAIIYPNGEKCWIYNGEILDIKIMKKIRRAKTVESLMVYMRDDNPGIRNFARRKAKDIREGRINEYRKGNQKGKRSLKSDKRN